MSHGLALLGDVVWTEDAGQEQDDKRGNKNGDPHGLALHLVKQGFDGVVHWLGARAGHGDLLAPRLATVGAIDVGALPAFVVLQLLELVVALGADGAGHSRPRLACCSPGPSHSRTPVRRSVFHDFTTHEGRHETATSDTHAQRTVVRDRGDSNGHRGHANAPDDRFSRQTRRGKACICSAFAQSMVGASHRSSVCGLDTRRPAKATSGNAGRSAAPAGEPCAIKWALTGLSLMLSSLLRSTGLALGSGWATGGNRDSQVNGERLHLGISRVTLFVLDPKHGVIRDAAFFGDDSQVSNTLMERISHGGKDVCLFHGAYVRAYLPYLSRLFCPSAGDFYAFTLGILAK